MSTNIISFPSQKYIIEFYFYNQIKTPNLWVTLLKNQSKCHVFEAHYHTHSNWKFNYNAILKQYKIINFDLGEKTGCIRHEMLKECSRSQVEPFY